MPSRCQPSLARGRHDKYRRMAYEIEELALMVGDSAPLTSSRRPWRVSPRSMRVRVVSGDIVHGLRPRARVLRMMFTCESEVTNVKPAGARCVQNERSARHLRAPDGRYCMR